MVYPSHAKRKTLNDEIPNPNNRTSKGHSSPSSSSSPTHFKLNKMPCDYSKYPKNWKTEIRPRILARAGNKCEGCGIENGLEGWRFPSGNFYTIESFMSGYIPPADEAHCDTICAKPPMKIVLTIAHLHDPDPMNCAVDNLKALCQRCHNILDAPMRKVNAAATRLRKKESIPNLFTK